MTLEQLLDKLIKKGWKPFRIEWIKEFHLKTYKCERWTNKIMIKHFEWYFTDGIKTSDYPNDYWTRMYVVYWLKHITAKESWLWQFVCENGMIKWYTRKAYMWQYRDPLGTDWDRTYRKEHYQYRLIESALCDEDKLEQFLLDNIKIWNYEN